MNKDKIVIIQKHKDDEFPINSDAFHAYLGFRKLGYRVIFKSYEDIILYKLIDDNYNSINKEDIVCVYGEVRFSQYIMKMFGIKIPEGIDYILQDTERWSGGLYYRRIYKVLANKNSLRSLIDIYFSNFPKENICFVKGSKTKHIHSGFIIRDGFDKPDKDNYYTYDEFISLNEKYLNENIYLWLSEFKDITSEWRLYIYKNEIVGMVNYSGNFLTIPNLTNIKYNLSNKENKDKYPIAFSIDVGFCDRKYFSPDSLVIECNDFYSIGNYGGITDELFAEMLIARWEELSNA